MLYDSNPVLYEYDMDFNLLKEYPLALEFPSYNYSIPFVDIFDTQKRLLEQEKLYYANHTFLQMHQHGDKVYLTYPKPINHELISELSTDGIESTYVLHQLNLRTNEQNSSILPKHLNAFKFTAKSEDTLLIIKKLNTESETPQLYEVKVDKE